MPASRRARAMTFAPRSCPSSPDFAMMMRGFVMAGDWNRHSNAREAPGDTTVPRIRRPPARSDRDRLDVFAPDFAQGAAHFTDRDAGPCAVDQDRHQVVRPPRGLGK